MHLTLISGSNEKLKQISKTVPVEDMKKARKIARNMFLLLQKHPLGCGLAAVQVGILKQVFIIRHKGFHLMVINPEILSYSEEKSDYEEGCLTYPDQYKVISRSESIDVKFHSGTEIIKMKLEGFIARIFQHEYDHLHGKTCVV